MGRASWSLHLGLLLLPSPLSSFPTIQAQGIPEFNKLRTPPSPAFSILGVTPTQVHRPTTPATFALAFLEDLGQGGNLIPRNFALETTPYWWFDHPELTMTQYEQAGPRSLYRNLSVSIATTSRDSQDNEPSRHVGLGLRTSLLTGQTASRECIGPLQELATEISRRVGERIATAVAADPTLPDDALEELRERFFREDPDREKLEEDTELCVAELSARTGFVVDLSSAVAFQFAAGEANAGNLTDAGLWLSPAYLQGSFSGVGVLRLLWNERDDTDAETGIDVGARAVYSRSRFAASLETVWRQREGEEDEALYRIASILDLKIAENIWATVSFGRDFKGNEPGSLITLANIQWSLGDRTIRP